MRYLKYRLLVDCAQHEEFTTIDENYAAVIMRRNFPERSWTEAEAIAEFIRQFEAVYVSVPHMLEEISLREAAQRFLEKHNRSLRLAAKKAACDQTSFARMLSGHPWQPPDYVMKRLGIVRETRYYLRNIPAADPIDALGAPMLPDSRRVVGISDMRLPSENGPEGLDDGVG
jgi:hypothetical protein